MVAWNNTNRLTHGHARRGRITPEYRVWKGIKDRCLRKGYRLFRDYGGRGIGVCDRWRDSFEDFLSDVGPRPSPKHSIERIKNDGHYEPGNCRWATRPEQCRNRRSNRPLTFNGETMCLFDWARRLGMKPRTLWRRIAVAGWPVERALTEPV